MTRIAVIATLVAMFLAPSFASAWGTKAAAPKVLACDPQPHTVVSDKSGRPASAIFLCFRDDGVVTYASRALTAEEAARLAPAAPASAPKADGLVWDRPECAYYRPDAQATFCKRVKPRLPRAAK